VRRSRPEAGIGEDRRPGATTSRPADDPDRPGDANPTAVPAGFEVADCKRRALDLLARREHSRLELERKLAARGFAAEAVAVALDDLERSGALAADRFTDSFVRSRAAKGQGPVRIRAELAERGVDEAQAAAATRDAGVDWAETARAVRGKRFGSVPPRDFKERARQARFLEYRGFERNQILRALGQGDDGDR
jgi:regulatory protein